MTLIEKALRNIQKNGNPKKNANDWLWTIGGGVLTPLIPTMIQGFFKVDMTGWRGWWTGLLSTVLLGFAVDKPKMSLGSMGVSAVHLMYVQFNDSIAALFGTPIYRFSQNAQLFDNAPPQDVTKVTLPDGRTVYANVASQIDRPSQVNDYVESPMMNDYVETPATTKTDTMSPQMNDFVSQLGSGMSDDYLELVANGGGLN